MRFRLPALALAALACASCAVGRGRPLGWDDFPSSAAMAASFAPYEDHAIDGEPIARHVRGAYAVVLQARSGRLVAEHDRVRLDLVRGGTVGGAVPISGDGYILTAAHVVDLDAAPVVGLMGADGVRRWHHARRVWMLDEDQDGQDVDLAVLKIDARLDRWWWPDGGALPAGTPLVAAGWSPSRGADGRLRLSQDLDHLDGICVDVALDVAAGEVLADDAPDGRLPLTELASTLPIRYGYSGGGAFTLEGRLVGVVFQFRIRHGGGMRAIAQRVDGAWLRALIERDRRLAPRRARTW